MVVADGVRGVGAGMNGELQAAIEDRIMTGTSWMGVPALKNPMDAWVYQEIIFEQRPDVVVEIGNYAHGSLLYLAALCDWVGHGEVVGVDISRKFAPVPARIVTIDGDAIDVFPAVREIVAGRSCLVIEDSAHTYDHTLAVLRSYSTLVQPGGYLICEDGVMAPVADALATFALEQDDLVADPDREWPVTWNPNGYLRRVR